MWPFFRHASGLDKPLIALADDLLLKYVGGE
jgi:hypothetical protein